MTSKTIPFGSKTTMATSKEAKQVKVQPIVILRLRTPVHPLLCWTIQPVQTVLRWVIRKFMGIPFFLFFFSHTQDLYRCFVLTLLQQLRLSLSILKSRCTLRTLFMLTHHPLVCRCINMPDNPICELMRVESVGGTVHKFISTSRGVSLSITK